jgi:hypothetical protein
MLRWSEGQYRHVLLTLTSTRVGLITRAMLDPCHARITTPQMSTQDIKPTSSHCLNDTSPYRADRTRR